MYFTHKFINLTMKREASHRSSLLCGGLLCGSGGAGGLAPQDPQPQLARLGFCCQLGEPPLSPVAQPAGVVVRWHPVGARGYVLRRLLQRYCRCAQNGVCLYCCCLAPCLGWFLEAPRLSAAGRLAGAVPCSPLLLGLWQLLAVQHRRPSLDPPEQAHLLLAAAIICCCLLLRWRGCRLLLLPLVIFRQPFQLPLQSLLQGFCDSSLCCIQQPVLSSRLTLAAVCGQRAQQPAPACPPRPRTRRTLLRHLQCRARSRAGQSTGVCVRRAAQAAAQRWCQWRWRQRRRLRGSACLRGAVCLLLERVRRHSSSRYVFGKLLVAALRRRRHAEALQYKAGNVQLAVSTMRRGVQDRNYQSLGPLGEKTHLCDARASCAETCRKIKQALHSLPRSP